MLGMGRARQQEIQIQLLVARRISLCPVLLSSTERPYVFYGNYRYTKYSTNIRQQPKQNYKTTNIMSECQHRVSIRVCFPLFNFIIENLLLICRAKFPLFFPFFLTPQHSGYKVWGRTQQNVKTQLCDKTERCYLILHYSGVDK